MMNPSTAQFRSEADAGSDASRHDASAQPAASAPHASSAPHAADPRHQGPTDAGGEAGSGALTAPIRGVGGLLFNVVIPLLLLAAGTGIVVAIGSVEPKARQAEDQTPLGRLRRLPPAEVMQVVSLAEVGQPLELRVDGVVVPYREVQLAAEVAGRIIEKTEVFRTGNFVTQGQLLCRIDPTDYEQEILRLTRAREQDYEAIKEVDQEIANAQSMLKIVEQEVELAQRELARMQSLPRGFVSESEIDQAQKALLAATQSRVTYESQMNLLAARRGRLEASERLATTQLETAQINLARCEVRSPGDGVIVREDADVNSFVQRGSPIVTLEDVSKAEVTVNLRMDQLYWVLDQDPAARLANTASEEALSASARAGYSLPATPAVVEYEVAGLGGRTYRWDGMLVRYGGIGMDSGSRTVPVTIEVDAPGQFIRPQDAAARVTGPSSLVRGMFVKVRLMIQPQTPLVAIPSLAIRPGNRVWQFQEDPSVLHQPLPGEGEAASADASAAGQAAPAGSPQGGSEDAGGLAENGPAGQEQTGGDPAESLELLVSSSAAGFDPSQWIAGRVIAHGNITPVDSLWISDQLGAEPSGTGQAAADQRRYWVCDAQQAQLAGGDFVVISPLGEVGRDLGQMSLPVRVPRPSEQPASEHPTREPLSSELPAGTQL